MDQFSWYTNITAVKRTPPLFCRKYRDGRKFSLSGPKFVLVFFELYNITVKLHFCN